MEPIHDRPRSVDRDDVLQRLPFAHLATTSEHGPKASPVGFLREDAAIWILAHRVSSIRGDHSRRCHLKGDS